MKIYKVTVAEPWDFEGPDGPNTIKGSIIKILDVNCVVFRTPYRLQFKGKEGDVFILSARNWSFEHLKKEGEIIVNIGLFLGTNIDNKTSAELKANSMFVMIGSLLA